MQKLQHARPISTPKILGQPSTAFDEYETDNGQSIGSTSQLGHTPFGHGHTRPPSPALEDFPMIDSPKRVVEVASPSPSHHGYGYRPPSGSGSGTHGVAVSNGFDVQRPRALISAYGTDERNKMINQNHQHGKNLNTNGLGSKGGVLTWQNAEEEEFEWEDMSPTLAGSSKRGQMVGPNRTGFGRGDWSSQERVPSVASNNAVSLVSLKFFRFFFMGFFLSVVVLGHVDNVFILFSGQKYLINMFCFYVFLFPICLLKHLKRGVCFVQFKPLH